MMRKLPQQQIRRVYEKNAGRKPPTRMVKQALRQRYLPVGSTAGFVVLALLGNTNVLGTVVVTSNL